MNAKRHPLEPLILRLIDGRISASELDRLQEAMRADESLRKRYVQLSGIEFDLRTGVFRELEFKASITQRSSSRDVKGRWAIVVTLAAAIALLVGGSWWIRKLNFDQRAKVSEEQAPESPTNYRPALAKPVRMSGVRWAEEENSFSRSDIVRRGPLAILGGEMQLDFFTGTSMFLRGATELEIESEWLIKLNQGVCRVLVPEPAEGFTIQVGEWEIVDLGTEFSVEVVNNQASVEVLNGIVELRSPDGSRSRMLAGERRAFSVSPSRSSTNESESAEIADRFGAWKKWSGELASDPRLIAYYPISRTASTRKIKNWAESGSGSECTIGDKVLPDVGRFFRTGRSVRFDGGESGLRFHDGISHETLTLACWVRVDSLPHVYNALLQCDHFDPGEFHWMFTRDGKLVLFLMAGNEEDAKLLRTDENQLIWEQPWFRRFESPVIWSDEKAGAWMHLATTIDTANRIVRHFVDGVQVAKFDRIGKRHMLDHLKIGDAEFGNWGTPYATKFYFAQRNLHGAIDDAMIFSAALTAEEIEKLYESSRP
ncbi:MAG: LamG-like jellyroll fold domain-containing protein [Planctomycetota bacterium]